MNTLVRALTSLEVTGDISQASSSYLTAVVEPISPAIHSELGNYILHSFGTSAPDGKRSAEYLIQINQAGKFAMLRLMVIHDGVSVYTNEYGRVDTDETGVEFTANIINNVVYLNYTQSAVVTQVRALATFLSL